MRYRSSVLLGITALLVSGCVYEVEFDPELIAEESPSYIAEAQILVVMPSEEREFIYEGSPTTEVGNFTTLEIPLGQVMQEITAHVFESCFMYGVAFSETLTPDPSYVIAIEPQLQDFSYGYHREPDPDFGIGVDGEQPVMMVTPQVEFDLMLKAYNANGEPVLDRVYESGLVSGESYYVTNRPQDRINSAFHSALQEVMQTVADDIRPYLVGQCEITDFVPG